MPKDEDGHYFETPEVINKPMTPDEVVKKRKCPKCNGKITQEVINKEELGRNQLITELVEELK